VGESLRSRGVTVGLSCLLHLGLAMALVLGQHWVPVAIAVRPPEPTSGNSVLFPAGYQNIGFCAGGSSRRRASNSSTCAELRPYVSGMWKEA